MNLLGWPVWKECMGFSVHFYFKCTLYFPELTNYERFISSWEIIQMSEMKILSLSQKSNLQTLIQKLAVPTKLWIMNFDTVISFKKTKSISFILDTSTCSQFMNVWMITALIPSTRMSSFGNNNATHKCERSKYKLLKLTISMNTLFDVHSVVILCMVLNTGATFVTEVGQ